MVRGKTWLGAEEREDLLLLAWVPGSLTAESQHQLSFPPAFPGSLPIRAGPQILFPSLPSPPHLTPV